MDARGGNGKLGDYGCRDDRAEWVGRDLQTRHSYSSSSALRRHIRCSKSGMQVWYVMIALTLLRLSLGALNQRPDRKIQETGGMLV